MLRLLAIFGLTFVQTALSRLRQRPVRPAWNFQFEWIVRFLRRDFSGSAHWPYPRLRADLDARPGPRAAQQRVTITEQQLGGIRVIRFTPPRLRGEAVLLYFHGGSYIFGSARTTHAELLAKLALSLELRVLAPEYRLAPEHPYPAALEDAQAVYAALRQSGLDADMIALAGDSAGGNLALCLQLRLREQAVPQARAAALISPWLDLTASLPSCQANERSDYGRTSFLHQHARDFAQAIPLDDPRVSPLSAELAGLAPLFVQVGGAERLYDEGVELVARARQAGVQAELDVAIDMPHNPPVLADFHPHAAAALERLATYITHSLSRSTEASVRGSVTTANSPSSGK